ncbi:hypothetical protein ACFS5L_33260 [Streptomyces phyllanthi]|uniref:Uncharacterized protein n=1 Tax=Streptomyces phyllanthi TaxID=1803180 RepID=A0A5N8W9Y7_9ACTN|nr:hypothetical protein [Streptomyces phyllanthi]MPY44291.1 hypothetical protein [Streptomyces phyllanthi]
MQRPYRLFTLVLSAGLLVLALAWLREAQQYDPEDSPASTAPSAASLGSRPVAPAPALSGTRLRGALLRTDDLGSSWGGTQGAATWRDGLLKGRADRPECQELLDAVYAEDLLGEPNGATAVAGFDDTEYGAQVRYQVGAYRKAGVDEKIAHVGELAGKCQEFTVAGVGGQTYGARVEPVEIPPVGDARQALRLTVGGEEGNGDALTLDIAALRVGDGAALLTHGGLYGINPETTRHAAELGARRLQQAVSPPPSPTPARPSG